MTPPNIPPQQLRFFLQNATGFHPPPDVAALKDTVAVDLLLGAQLLWTAVMKKKSVTYGGVHDWISLTHPGKSPHCFADSSFGEDSEVSGELSSMFSKLVGLAFLGQYAKATWFKVLRPLWGDTLMTKNGALCIEKKKKEDHGPDYLVAPFDPASSELGGPFYAVEFKGKHARLEFDSAVFRDWSEQAKNISMKDSKGVPVNLKSWVVGFNYGFAKPRLSREESTLLVEDPEIAPGAPSLEADRLNASSIIRDHLSRQCFMLGAAVLAVPVRVGSGFDGLTSLPTVYKIDHHRLQDRRYIGHWYFLADDGDLERSHWPFGSLDLRDWEGGDGIRQFLVSHQHKLFEILVCSLGSNSGTPTPSKLTLFGGQEPLFVGQDATMLRRCIKVPADQPLDGTPFEDELHFSEQIGEGSRVGWIRALRNGSIVASGVPIHVDDGEFWPAK